MTAATANLRRFAALESRDFVLLWLGQGISQLGTRTQRAAIAWQLYQLTRSPLALGLLGLTRFAAIAIFALGAGVVADSLDRRRVMLVAQTLLALGSTTLAVLTLTAHITPTAIYTVTFVTAAAASFDGAARQALVAGLVPREHLANALSLNVLTFQVASVVGPALGGLLLATRGAGSAYVLDAVSFLAVIAALVAIRRRGPASSRGSMSMSAALDGLRFVVHQPLVFGLMLLDFLGTLFAGALLLLPVFATDVLHVGAAGYGLLCAAPATGAVVAAVVMAALAEVQARGAVVLVSIFIYGASTALFGASRWFALSALMLAISGAADTVSTVVRQTVRNLVTPNELRGRMTSVNMIFFVGGPQLGELEAGAAARLVGAPLSVVLGGAACAALALIVALAMPSLRRHRSDAPDAPRAVP